MTNIDSDLETDVGSNTDAPSPVPDTYNQYTETRENPRFTDWLRARAGSQWDAATAHRFTRELGSDDLDPDVFRRYLVQDYAFVETLVGVFGHAVGQAPTMAAKSELVDFLGTLTDDEDDYFLRSFDALDVPESTYMEPSTTPTTRAFVDLLERAANQGGYAETLAVLVPAEWVYLTWASAVEDQSPSRFYLAEWIDLHAADDFAAFVNWLREELDREGAAASPHRQQRLDRLFRRMVELEVAFFDAAYESTSADGVRITESDEAGDAEW
ncbi:transcriptional regulator (plasmid) [Haloferax mediterranei ATCC 33500]|uniref:Transcriptional activator TenA n=1 Tax=Haloferax mediterranei (strain ATCC 33500 / DSM 1411 / JCM 8866 / NBRC 14739 / NCIMB 2177 / R-4) TaxID=523841 RepID=I3RA66_HALMT|nr:TenA family protein [Haloferax mediterranei]AFK21126.1 transcriptional activator TenA [Haloferax mediterranei ATCC 33500]AHZ24289.1 transcriptional regulator [Haloferax mediterranei ATCC 33500]EMA05373.1 transcriptional activator TenA [Haloferax mediterranei ATCC 33500]MDX5989828.1 TenA family protein [Haloferax mediterranei ATCC 33500]QCQ77271.1 transcriptional regulator [Haloferax mediterranei ATCC 33500]